MGLFDNEDEVIQKIAEASNTVHQRPIPESDLRQLLTYSFWASLQTNEHRSCRFRIAFVDPERAGVLIRFEVPQELSSANIRRLAAGTGLQSSIGVWPDEKGYLVIWGIALKETAANALVECVGAGVLRTWLFLTSAPVAIFEPEGARFFGRNASLTPHLRALFELDIPDLRSRVRHVNILKSVLNAVAEKKHGGTILVVPPQKKITEKMFSNWSIRGPEPLPILTTLIQDNLSTPEPSQALQHWEILDMHSMQRSREMLINSLCQTFAALTEIDGALVLSPTLQLIGAGAKINADGEFKLRTIRLTEPAEIGETTVRDLGGTRHQSAARFVHQNTDCTAFVVSSDGPVTGFAWITDKKVVAALQRLDWHL